MKRSSSFRITQMAFSSSQAGESHPVARVTERLVASASSVGRYIDRYTGPLSASRSEALSTSNARTRSKKATSSSANRTFRVSQGFLLNK